MNELQEFRKNLGKTERLLRELQEGSSGAISAEYEVRRKVINDVSKAIPETPCHQEIEKPDHDYEEYCDCGAQHGIDGASHTCTKSCLSTKPKS